MKRSFISNTGKWAVRLFLTLVVLISLGVSSAQSGTGGVPNAPGKTYLPVVVRSGPGLVPLIAQCVDCPRNISAMTAHSLRLDGSNHPHIAYGSDHLYHAWNDGTGWKTEVVDPAPGVGYAASLAFDNTGKVGISYYDDYNHSLKLARWNGTTWTLQTVDSSPYAGFTSSLAFDSTGKPRIAYEDYDLAQSIFRIKYTEWSGAAWNSFPAIDHTENYQGTTSLALDHSGQTHISYWRENYGVSGGLIYASWISSAWTLQIVETDTDIGRDNSLAFDSQDKPHICYSDYINYYVKYATFNGSQWSKQPLTAANPGRADDRFPICSIKIGSGNLPYVSYFSKINRHLAITHPVGGNWVSEIVDASGDNGEHNSLGMYNGVPYITYYHASNKDLQFMKWKP